MKAVLKTVFLVLFWLLIIALLVGGLLVVCYFMDLPNIYAFAGATIIAGLVLAIVLVRRIITRRHRYQQIQSIVTLAPDSIIESDGDSRIIENRWNRAVAIMHKSYLGKWGNPLYALPWYMVMGRTGAGKSSSIKHSGLSAMQTDVGPEDAASSTRNCEWHFFREAIVMDTAGRYAVPLNEAQDSAEWQEFLSRLAKYRNREPLNGLVLTVSADTLHGSGEHLLPEARCLRRRIDETMRILGAKFPIYLMVTKIDLPSGMARFLEELPDAAKKESFGVFIQDPEKKNLLPVEAQITNATQELTAKLRRFFLFARDGSETPSPHRILAWEELKAMMPALRVYAEEIFSANPYQEKPLLRGIFFSSALRGPQENSRAFPAISGLVKRFFRIKNSVEGIFLHDFFGHILPMDRGLHRPIAEYLRWRSSVRTIAYGAMLLATFGLCLTFFLSFQHNFRLLDTMAHPKTVPADASMARRVLAFEQQFREAAILEKQVRAGTFHALFFEHVDEAFSHFEAHLNEAFNTSVLETALATLDEKRSRLTEKSDDREFFTLVSDVIWRHDLLTAVSKGKSFEQLLQIPAMPQGILQALGLDETSQMAPSIAYSIARYTHSMRDPVEREQKLQALRSILTHLPEVKSHSLHWIVHRAGTLSTLLPVQASSFWPSSQSGSLEGVMLDPVYTREGLAVTLEYLDNLNLIYSDDTMKPSTASFLRWYAANYATAWFKFAHEFVEKSAPLATLPVSGEVLSAMSGSHNPYFSLLMRMDHELQAVRGYLDPMPPWFEYMELFALSLRLTVMDSPEKQNVPWKDRLKHNVSTLYSDIAGTVNNESRERDMKAQALEKNVQAYLASLRELVNFTLNNSLAFNAVKDAMPHENNQKAPTAPLNLALVAKGTLVAHLNPKPVQNSPVSRLIAAPLEFFRQKLMNSASCQIQAMWEGDVLTKAGRLSPAQLQQGLFATQGGIVRAFSDNELAFFLNHTLNGYEPETVAGHPIPFTPDFLTFLNTGLETYRPVNDSYSITLDALPADVNDGAFETPYAVELALHCAREKQEFINYNSPGSTRLAWTRGACGDTLLTIRFKTLTLEVLYAGENGFLNFLTDFQYGTRNFHASDFPDQAAALGKMGVSTITVRYKIAGADDILAGHRFAPGTLPFVATECKR